MNTELSSVILGHSQKEKKLLFDHYFPASAIYNLTSILLGEVECPQTGPVVQVG
jgi:hypothetical protein